MTEFADRVLAWFDAHGRKDLPWQGAGAYGVWISEIMLQQTQVRTVIPYYERFVSSFPDVVALADAHVDDVLAHWSGLGYYARGRNLHKAAILIRDDHNGEFPREFDTVAALPGIGRSTAGAILAQAFGQRHAILDGNVKRVLARHAAIKGWPGKTSVAYELWEIAEARTPEERVDAYTQAIMDIGATVCTRTNPGCTACPVAGDCAALLAGTIDNYPGRKPKKDKPLKQTTMVLAVHDGTLYLERRPPSGIWGGLWSLPEISDGTADDWCRQVLAAESQATHAWEPLRHSFSHYDLDIHPIVVHVNGGPRKAADDDSTWHSLHTAPPGGMAAPVRKLIDELKKASHVANG